MQIEFYTINSSLQLWCNRRLELPSPNGATRSCRRPGTWSWSSGCTRSRDRPSPAARSGIPPRAGCAAPRRSSPPRLRDHQLLLFNGAQLLPVDDNGNMIRRVAKPRFQNIRNDYLEALDQSLARRRLSRDPAVRAGRDPDTSVSVVECVEG